MNCVDLTLSSVAIEWYNPQGQLVSKDDGDAVNQLQAGRLLTIVTAQLTFQRYQQSQVEGTSAECLVQGKTWRGCLFALVSRLVYTFS